MTPNSNPPEEQLRSAPATKPEPPPPPTRKPSRNQRKKLVRRNRKTERENFERNAAELIRDLETRKNIAYGERNRCVALIARLALELGFKAGVAQHDPEDASWEKDWRTILFVELPTGQLSWHFHDSEKGMLEGLPVYDSPYDGHTTEEKYLRIGEFVERLDEAAAKHLAALQAADAELATTPAGTSVTASSTVQIIPMPPSELDDLASRLAHAVLSNTAQPMTVEHLAKRVLEITDGIAPPTPAPEPT